MLNRSTLTIAFMLCAAGAAASTAAMQRRSTQPDLTMGRDWDEGGTVGCGNGRGMSDQARIIARNIGRGDDCDNELQPQPRVALTGSWVDVNAADGFSGVWAEGDDPIFLRYECAARGNTRFPMIAIGGEDMRNGTNSTSPAGQRFLVGIGRNITSARLTIFVRGEPPRILQMNRRVTAGADWGFNVSPNPATLVAIQRASHYEVRLGNRTLIFTGTGSTRAITRTECPQMMD